MSLPMSVSKIRRTGARSSAKAGEASSRVRAAMHTDDRDIDIGSATASPPTSCEENLKSATASCLHPDVGRAVAAWKPHLVGPRGSAGLLAEIDEEPVVQFQAAALGVAVDL